MMEKIGVVHGSFQVIHYDHMQYLSAGRAHCQHLVIGITNPDPRVTHRDETDPLTFYERYRIVRAACEEQAWDTKTFSIVPFPINEPEMYKHYVPMDALFLLTIYDDWGERKLQLFKSLGLRTHILWRKPLSDKGMTSTDIRRRIAAGEHWDHLVPRAAVQVMKKMGLIEKIKKCSIKAARGLFAGET